jgi:hypothetical protein
MNGTYQKQFHQDQKPPADQQINIDQAWEKRQYLSNQNDLNICDYYGIKQRSPY